MYIYIYKYIYGESIDIGSNMLTSYYHMQKQANGEGEATNTLQHLVGRFVVF